MKRLLSSFLLVCHGLKVHKLKEVGEVCDTIINLNKLNTQRYVVKNVYSNTLDDYEVNNGLPKVTDLSDNNAPKPIAKDNNDNMNVTIYNDNI